jgi:hypothetical protein
MPTHARFGSVLLRDAVMVSCIAAWIGSVFALFPAPASPKPPAWPDGLLVLFALISTGLSLARTLPAQNIVAVAAIAWVVTGAAFASLAFNLTSTARIIYSESLGPAAGGRVPWIQWPVWLVVLVMARGVAMLIVRPVRVRSRYGLWLMGVTAMLVVGLSVGLEVLATQVKHYWRWEISALREQGIGLLGPAVALWFMAAIVFQLLALPWLVSKRPVEPPPDWHPLILWCLVNLWITAGTSTRGWLGTAALVAVLTAIITALAVRGGTAGAGRVS